MKLSKYGIVLDRLRQEDIELVRSWRNSPMISQFMEFREQITPEMQKEWFKSVDNIENFYFVVVYQGKKIGLINSSNVQWATVSSEGGIFLWDEAYYETLCRSGLHFACLKPPTTSWEPVNHTLKPSGITKGRRS